MKRAPGPLLLFVLTILSVFWAEVLVMYLLPLLPAAPDERGGAFLDGLLLIALIFPAVYFFSYRPLSIRIREREIAEDRLRQTNEQLQSQALELEGHRRHLAEQVEHRTAELTSVVECLKGEIAERRQAEQSLHHSENLCRLMVDHLPQKIYLKDQDSVYLYCNDNFARDLGIQAGEIVGKTDYDLFPPETAERNRAEDRMILASGEPLDAEEKQVKDKEEVVIHKFKMPARNGAGGFNCILGILWDITQRVRLEAIAEAVTLTNNIGYIFQGVGHEIGNPVNAAKVTLTVLKKKLPSYSRETVEQFVEKALGEIGKVEYLLRSLRSYNMYETPALQNVELRPFMDNFLALLAQDFSKKGLTLDVRFAPEVRWGFVDPRALQQVLLNVMNNAADAVEGREAPRIAVQVGKRGDAVRIEVKDNGWGISEEQMKRVFTPFFTSKPSGTGLGLVIAKKLLSRMGGAIEMESRSGKGTRVEISIQEGRDEP